MVRNLTQDDRETLDNALLAGSAEPDPETGQTPPTWWKGEEDAARSAQAFFGATRLRR